MNTYFTKEIIYIFTCKYGYYISLSIQYLLFKNNITSKIIFEIDHTNPNLHIILFSQKVKIFPKNYIIYQLEQKDISKWINKKYELSILFSKYTWDYSQSNIDKFPNIIKQKMIYYPVPLVPYKFLKLNIKNRNNPTNDILFYGSINDARRKKINYLQKKLAPKYFIRIINNKYGEELFEEILNSKIVLNIHFYKDAILETCRINEILSCNRIVISELSNPIDDINYQLYKDKIIYINTMEEMYYKILYILDNNISSIFDVNEYYKNNEYELINFFNNIHI
jgi:hypothetical protein